MILLFHPRTCSASFAFAAATSAVFAGRGKPFSQQLLNVSEFQRHHTEDWKNFSQGFLRLLRSVIDQFLNFILTLLTLLTYVWTIGLSYCIFLCAICVIVYALRPEFFDFGQPIVFTGFVTVSHVISHARHTRRMLTRQSNLKVLSYALFRAVLVSLQLSPRLLKRNRCIKPKRFANLTSVCFAYCVFFIAHTFSITIIII